MVIYQAFIIKRLHLEDYIIYLSTSSNDMFLQTTTKTIPDEGVFK